MGSKRNAKYDFYRGLLMLGVVWGHTITALRFGVGGSSAILHFFRTYDMPMFAFISGYFLNKTIKKHGFCSNVLNKIGMILFPILLWNIIYSVINTVVFSAGISLSFSRFWFLWAIFIVSIMVLAIEKLFTFSKALKAIVYAVVTIVIHTFINLPHNVAFLFVPCVFGMYYDSIREKLLCNAKENSVRVIKLVFVVIFAVMQVFWDKSYNVWNTGNNIFAFSTPITTSLRIFYRMSIGIVGCIAMKTVFDLLYSFKCAKLKTALCNAGKNTLEIYIIQSFLVETLGVMAVAFVTKILGFNVFAVNMFLLDYVFAFVISSVSVAVCYYVQKWLKLIPKVGKYLFGIPFGRKKAAHKGE